MIFYKFKKTGRKKVISNLISERIFKIFFWIKGDFNEIPIILIYT